MTTTTITIAKAMPPAAAPPAMIGISSFESKTSRYTDLCNIIISHAIHQHNFLSHNVFRSTMTKQQKKYSYIPNLRTKEARFYVK